MIGLSGTPISGKPAEFFPVLQMIRPEQFSSFWKYAMEYCAPHKNPYSGTWDFSGASNLEALHMVLQDIMIRRMKHEVLKDLPRKTRTIIPISISNRVEYTRAENDFLRWLAEVKGDKAAKRAAKAEAIVRLNSLKWLTAQGKMKFALKWMEEWLESTDEKLIVFAYHRDSRGILKKAYPKAALVDGTVTGKKRQGQVDRFQTAPKCRVFLGQRQSAGTGLDGLQRASCNVLFLEIGWTSVEHNQAEDRALRIGQTKHVNVYYLVGRNTVEERMLSIIEQKDGVCAQVLDGKESGGMNLLTAFLETCKAPEPRPVIHIRLGRNR